MFFDLLILFASLLVVGIFSAIWFTKIIMKDFTATAKKMHNSNPFNSDFKKQLGLDVQIDDDGDFGFDMKMPSIAIAVLVKISSLLIYFGFIGLFVTVILRIAKVL